jgi:SAM-dependent methyltransferase
MSVIWHDLECGGYAADMPLWRSLAADHGDPILEIGSGTGRIALDLARRGYDLTAVDHDAEFVHELAERAGDLPVEAVHADARKFELARRFALCIVPMQTIQLLGGPAGRVQFLRRAKRHLLEGGVLAVALSDLLEPFEPGDGSWLPLPDVCELDGVLYSSQPTAIRTADDGFLLERRRETVMVDGRRTVDRDVVWLDRVTPTGLEREAAGLGLRAVGQRQVAATRDYVGSTVVMLRA